MGFFLRYWLVRYIGPILKIVKSVIFAIIRPMTDKLHDIERAVQGLPAPELAAFRKWFAEYDSGQWEDDIAKDAASGRLDDLIHEAKTAAKNGQATDL